MKTEINLPESIRSQIAFKRKFSGLEMYHAFVFMPRAITKLIGNHKVNRQSQKPVGR
jgi:hypothetical protein